MYENQNATVQETTEATQPTDPAGSATTETVAGGNSEPANSEVAQGENNPYLIPDEEEPASGEAAQPGAELKSYLEMSPYVTNAEQLQGAVNDSHLLWDVINGQQPAGNILEGLKTSNNEAWKSVVSGLAQYIAQETGFAFVDPKNLPQPENVDPMQQRISALEEMHRNEQQTREQQVITQRAQQANGTLRSHVESLVKGSFLEGEDLMPLLGAKLGDPLKIIEAVEKGDFSKIDAALKAVKKDEAARYNRYAQRVAAQRKAVANAGPSIDNQGTPAKQRNASKEFDLNTREGRIAYGLSLAQ